MSSAALAGGYESLDDFRSAFVEYFGGAAQPAPQHAIRIAWMESPLGPLLAGATGDAICLLEFTDRIRLAAQFQRLRDHFGVQLIAAESALLVQLREELAAYFSGGLKNFTVPLHYPGTPFQQRVWDALLRIPHGETRSYEDLALQLQSPKAIRAVGTANGANRIAILIPCHRVVNKSGKLGGYAGGLWRKQLLLDLERSDVQPRLI